MRTPRLSFVLSGLVFSSLLGMSGCEQSSTTAASTPQATPNPSHKIVNDELAALKATQAQEQKHLEIFDDLDFNVYSGQKWEDFHKSHAPNILVHYPDGRTTTGIEAHIDELKPMFVFAPDTKIKTHPIRIAENNFTAVMGVLEGTFSKPMPLGGGKFMPATNKPFKIEMTTLGRWENGVMVEEWLYWDNLALMKQMGIMK